MLCYDKQIFFLGKCVRTAAKTMVVDRKNQKARHDACVEPLVPLV